MHSVVLNFEEGLVVNGFVAQGEPKAVAQRLAAQLGSDQDDQVRIDESGHDTDLDGPAAGVLLDSPGAGHDDCLVYVVAPLTPRNAHVALTLLSEHDSAGVLEGAGLEPPAPGETGLPITCECDYDWQDGDGGPVEAIVTINEKCDDARARELLITHDDDIRNEFSTPYESFHPEIVNDMHFAGPAAGEEKHCPAVQACLELLRAQPGVRRFVMSGEVADVG